MWSSLAVNKYLHTVASYWISSTLIFISLIILVLSKFITKLLTTNRLIARGRTKFDAEQKLRNFLLEIVTVVPSASKDGSDTEFIVRGRSYIYMYIYIYIYIYTQNVKCSRYRPGVAQRVGRGIALLFHDRGTRRG